MKTIGEKISIARGNGDLTRSELAAILKIAPEKVVDWEKNIDVPNAVMIKRLSEILNVPVNYFFDDTDFSKNDSKDVKVTEANSKDISIILNNGI